DGGDCGCEAWPLARGHAGGRGAPAPSVDVSRQATRGGRAATRQTHVPDRHLRGLLPDALLDAYAFWRNADDASLCGYARAAPADAVVVVALDGAPARPRVVIVDFVGAASPNERQQASRLAMACLTHVRRKGVRSILQDVEAHPADVELSDAMEAALWCTVIRLPALLLCNPQAAVGPLFFAMFREDYSARRFLIFKDRIEREALLRAVDVQRSALRSVLRRIEDAAPQEKPLVELTQEERYMLHAHVETLTTGKELKACCVAFGLPPGGATYATCVAFGLPPGGATYPLVKLAAQLKAFRLWLVAALAARCSAELSAIAVESAETLTVKKFRARYVRHQLPVIIRPSLNAPNWTHLDFKRMCGAGPITRYEVQPELNQWGGLGVGVPMELDKMIEELYAKNVRTYYGFGFDLKCGCPPFTEKAELLKVFEEDRYKHSEFGKSNWPELIVGSRDSFTALHVDKGMMPFWLKLIEGEKDFRVVPLPEWRGKLDGADDAGAPFVGGPFPSLKAPFDAFDDALVERRWIQERNASVYAGTMEAGDWMYIPVGAFHGAKNNLRTPSVSMSGNYWDKTHRRQILENFCEPM
ncbi:hypothetical protein AURANDRAFT_68784, partial [Aureococcus anophagefferens]